MSSSDKKSKENLIKVENEDEKSVKKPSIEADKSQLMTSIKTLDLAESEVLSEEDAQILEVMEEMKDSMEASSKAEVQDDVDNDEEEEGEGEIETGQVNEDIEEEAPREIEVVVPLQGVEEPEEVLETAAEQQDTRTKPAVAKQPIKKRIVKAFDRKVKRPIKRTTGIEEFDRWYFIVALLVFLCLIMVSTLPFLLTTIADTELGIGYSYIAGTFQRGIIKSGGVRMKQWGGSVIRWPRTDQIIEFVLDDGAAERNSGDNKSQRIKTVPRLYCNSKDGLEIEMSTVVHMRIIESQIKRLTQLYGSFNSWFSLVTTQIRSSSLHFCQNITAFDFQARRLEVSIALEDLVRQEVFNRFRGDIKRVALINVARPAQFEQALVDLENGRSIITLAQTEREGAIIEAETLLDIAENEVVRLLDTAQKDAEVKLILAENVAESLLDRVAQLSVVFERVQNESQLDSTQTLTFIESLLLVDDLTIGANAPVALTFKDDL